MLIVLSMSASIGYVIPFIPPLSFSTCNHPQCDCSLSVEQAINSTFLDSKSDNFSWNANNSVGQTNVKSFG